METYLHDDRGDAEYMYPSIESDYLGCIQGIHFIWFGYERYPKQMRGLTADSIKDFEINIPNKSCDMDIIDACDIVDGVMIACLDMLET